MRSPPNLPSPKIWNLHPSDPELVISSVQFYFISVRSKYKNTEVKIQSTILMLTKIVRILNLM